MPLENTFLLLEFKKIYVYEVFFEYLIGGIKLGAFFFLSCAEFFSLHEGITYWFAVQKDLQLEAVFLYLNMK